MAHLRDFFPCSAIIPQLDLPRNRTDWKADGRVCTVRAPGLKLVLPPGLNSLNLVTFYARCKIPLFDKVFPMLIKWCL